MVRMQRFLAAIVCLIILFKGAVQAVDREEEPEDGPQLAEVMGEMVASLDNSKVPIPPEEELIPDAFLEEIPVNEEPHYNHRYKKEIQRDFVEPEYGSGAFGDAGRFVIPEKEFAVPIWSNLYNDGQYVVDAWDSAIVLQDGPVPVIGDHVNQGFYVIKECTPGTLSYIENPNGRTWYVCESVDRNSINTGDSLLNSDGVNVEYIALDYLVTYTCNSEVPTPIEYDSVTITMWRETYVEENPFGYWVEREIEVCSELDELS